MPILSKQVRIWYHDIDKSVLYIIFFYFITEEKT